MNEKKNDFFTLYLILGLLSAILILSGIFLPDFLNFINVKLTKEYLLIMQVAFILSGIMDFVLLIYAKKKLS